VLRRGGRECCEFDSHSWVGNELVGLDAKFCLVTHGQFWQHGPMKDSLRREVG
jgi:hypothetical protein